MTEAAKQQLSPEDQVNDEIAADDPLFELSRIIGLDEKPPAPAVDQQIDLEEALLAEMAVEPAPQVDPVVEPDVEVEPEAFVDAPAVYEEIAAEPDMELDADPGMSDRFDFVETEEPSPEVVEPASAPTAASLEDELAAMLGGDVTVATQVPGPADFVAEELATDQSVEPEQDFVSAVDVEEAASEFAEPVQAAQEYDSAASQQMEPIEQVEPAVAAEEQPIEAFELPEAEDHSQPAEINVEAAAAEEVAPVSFEEPALEENVNDVIDDDFAAFFENELPEIEVSAPEPAVEQVVEAVAAEAQETAAPILETADMSGFEAAEATEIDVPDLPEVDQEFAAIFDEDLNAEQAPDVSDDNQPGLAGGIAAAGVAAVAAATTPLAKRAGETAMANDDDAFDESRFEAELARDMEFVSHDLDIAIEPEDLSLDAGFEDQEFAVAAAENKPAKRGLVVAAILGCVAIAAAIGVFAFSGQQGGSDGGPVLVEADADPVKVAPENPGGKTVPNQDRAVFNETASAPAQEALNAGAEEPVDIAAVPESALPSTLNGGEAQKAEDRLIPDTATNDTTTSGEGALVAPRKVRTLVVKPDGTLVEREVVPTPEPVAPTAPVETAAAAPAAEATPTQPAAAPVIAAEQAPVAQSEPTAADATVETAAQQPAQNAASQAPTRVVRTQPIVAPAQIAERPADQPVNIVNPETNQVAAAPAPEPQPAPAATPFAVQLASLPTQADAQSSATNLSRRYGSVLGGRGVSIQRAVIEGRGTFYRVRVGATSRADANRLCGNIKSAGGDCFVTR